MDRSTYKSEIKYSNTLWLRNGDKTLLGIRKAAAPYGSDNVPAEFLFRQLRNVKMDIVYNGTISNDFDREKKGLNPIVFCHGLCSNRTMHSGTCKDFASHGFIVFMQDYHDKTSSYV